MRWINVKAEVFNYRSGKTRLVEFSYQVKHYSKDVYLIDSLLCRDADDTVRSLQPISIERRGAK